MTVTSFPSLNTAFCSYTASSLLGWQKANPDLSAASLSSEAAFRLVVGVEQNAPFNNIDDSLVGRLAESKTFSNIETLDLFNNDISDAGARSIVRSRVLQKLRYLRLVDNPITVDGAQFLRGSLSQRKVELHIGNMLRDFQ